MPQLTRCLALITICLFAALVPLEIPGCDENGSNAHAQTPTVTACVAKKGGAVRFISKGNCRSSENKVALSVPGPRGPQGPAGSPATVRAYSDEVTTPTRTQSVSLDPAVFVTGLDNNKTYSVIATLDVFDVLMDPSEPLNAYRIECVLNGTVSTPGSGVARSSEGIDLLNDTIRYFYSQTALLYVGKPSNGTFAVSCETGLGLTLGYKYTARIIATEVVAG